MKNRIKNFFQNFLKIIKRPEMRILPGQLAFYFVLAIVPTISLVTYIATLLNLPADFLHTFLTNVFSKDLANLLLSNELAIGSVSGARFLWVLIIASYISSNGSNSIIITSNTIYGIKNNSFIQRRIKALVMTLLMLFLVLFVLLIPVFSEKIVEIVYLMNLSSNVTDKIIWVIDALKSPVSWLLIFLIIKLIYTMAPDRKVEISKVNYGAVFTAVCWVLGTQVYSFYINHVAHYNAFYGALANVAILMLWFYYLAFVFTIGMALNYHKEEEEIEKTAALNVVNGE